MSLIIQFALRWYQPGAVSICVSIAYFRNPRVRVSDERPDSLAFLPERVRTALFSALGMLMSRPFHVDFQSTASFSSDTHGGFSGSAVAPVHHAIWEREIFHDIAMALPRRQVESLLMSFLNMLQSIRDRLQQSAIDLHEIRHIAHNVKAVSGQFGFLALSSFSDTLISNDEAPRCKDHLSVWLALIVASIEAAHNYLQDSSGATG